jgi:GT2 family glycosyltransferase
MMPVMAVDAVSVIALVAAYKRPAQLRNLLESFQAAGPLRRVIVVDNGMQAEIEAVCRQAPVPVQYHRPPTNLGCGGGTALGLQLGLQEPGVTHFCVFDDDAEATPGAIESLVQGMVAADADAAVPLILNSEGYISWFSGLQEALPWKTIRRPGLTPEAYRQICGLKPVPFSWACWPALAVSARVVRECGFPRDDFWLCAEDLEFTLRLTYRHRGVMVPTAACRHLPPPSSGGNKVGDAHYLRSCLLLQNLGYISTRLPHARRVLRHLPGNYLRLFRNFGFSTAALRDVFLAAWRGALRGKPAGVAGGDGFKHRFLELVAKR